MYVYIAAYGNIRRGPAYYLTVFHYILPLNHAAQGYLVEYWNVLADGKA